MEIRRRFSSRPPYVSSGGEAFWIPRQWIEKNAEAAIAIEFVTRRALFGQAYSQLQPDYFWDMPEPSGVFVLLFAPTRFLAPEATRPGDIDLLILPYEGDELILHRTVALEVKIVRPSFARPGRSPNDYGVSQAQALRALGFPYVGLLHLIVSDESPRENWAAMSCVEVLDETERAGKPHLRMVDTLPLMLIKRAFGRLIRVCPDEGIGLGAMFVRYADLETAARHGSATWTPACREAQKNPAISFELLERVAVLFEENPFYWFDTRRRD